MRFGQTKSAEQQGQSMQHRTRDVLIRQRAENAVEAAARRHLAYRFFFAAGSARTCIGLAP
jgi:hypothetical protein